MGGQLLNLNPCVDLWNPAPLPSPSWLYAPGLPIWAETTFSMVCELGWPAACWLTLVCYCCFKKSNASGRSFDPSERSFFFRLSLLSSVCPGPLELVSQLCSRNYSLKGGSKLKKESLNFTGLFQRGDSLTGGDEGLRAVALHR